MQMKSLMILSTSGLLLLACNQKANNDQADGSKARIDTVKVFSLKKERVEKQITLPGELSPNERVEIRPKVIGYIKQLKVDIGSMVKKGEVLVIIDAPEIEAKLGEANGRLQAAKAKYQTSLDMYHRILDASKTQGVISASELQRAKNQMSTDSAEYQASRFSSASYRQMGNYLAITAPFNGIITQRNVNEGAYVGTPNEKPIVVIEDNSMLRLRVAVPEALTAVSLRGDKAKFSTKANPNQFLEAALVRKAGTIDINTRTEVWEFEVRNEKLNLKPGTFANVTMNVFREQDSFLVPFSAVVTTLEKKFVIKISSDTTRWVDISQGLNLPDRTEIFGNINDGDTLMIKANEERKPNEKVISKFDK